MKCCLTTTRDLGCFTCDESIIYATAATAGEYAVTLHFRNSKRTEKKTYAAGELIDIAALFELNQSYQYTAEVTNPQGVTEVVCFTTVLKTLT